MAGLKRKQTDGIYDRLRSDILTMALRPGDDIDEQALAKRYGISRTPIREALIKLSADGLVTFGEKRGARITVLIIPDLPRFMEALDFNRRAACRLAAFRRHDHELDDIKAEFKAFSKVALSKGVGTDNLSSQVADHEMKLYVQISESGHNRYLTDAFSKLLTVGLRMMRLPFAYSPREGQTVQAYVEQLLDQHRALIAAIEARDQDGAEKCAEYLHQSLVKRLREYNEENLLSGSSIGQVAG
jgi:DNA-binding GntR family transcriptional regulator